MLTSFKRIIKSSWKNIIRNPWLTTATVFIIVMVIALITSLFLVRAMTSQLITELKSKVDVAVYFKNSVVEQDILDAKDEISKLANVKSVEYITAEQSMENFKTRNQNNKLLLQTIDELGSNPFPPALDIMVYEAPQYEALVSYLQSSSFNSLIDKIDYQDKKSVIDRLFSVTNSLNNGGIIFSVILGLLAILIAFNTIRLAIYTSREEISVQRLVGASNWFIRGPYVIQGALSGVVATVFCLIVFAILCFFASPQLLVIYPTFNLFQYFLNNIFLIFGIQLLTGVGLGVISSIIAIRRYLRV